MRVEEEEVSKKQSMSHILASVTIYLYPSLYVSTQMVIFATRTSSQASYHSL